jgi:hypothetical protein
MSSTTVRLAKLHTTFEPVALPDLQQAPEISDTEVRFVQTTGGRTGLRPRAGSSTPIRAVPRADRVDHAPLTIRADGTSSFEVLGASKFPRHWIYDGEGKIAAKVGLADFKDWYRDAFGKHTPWGESDSAALVTAVETALERQLSVTIMSGATRDPQAEEGQVPLQQDDPATASTSCSTACWRSPSTASSSPRWARCRLGWRAVLEGGIRTASLQAATDVRRRRHRRTRSTARRSCSCGAPPHEVTSRCPRASARGGGVAQVRIATWNVNSLKARQERVEEWRSYARPDVLCLQETKLSDGAFPIWRSLPSVTTRCTTATASGTVSRSCSRVGIGGDHRIRRRHRSVRG